MGKKVNLNAPRKKVADQNKTSKAHSFRNTRATKQSGQKSNNLLESRARSVGTNTSDYEMDDKINATITFPQAIVKYLPIILILSPFILLMLFVSLFSDGDNNAYGLNGYAHYEGGCSSVQLPDGSMLDMEDYVAGVLSKEVAGFPEESLKAIAVAARTHSMANTKKVGNDTDSCYYIIPSITDNFQVYGPTTNELYINAAKDTRGLIITFNGSLKGGSYYDASCVYTADQAKNLNSTGTYDSNNYYIKYGGDFLDGVHFQEIPISEASQVGTLTSWVNYSRPCSGNHGRGISQNGAWYLEKFQDNDWKSILNYFFDNQVEIMSIYKSYGYSGEYPIEPNNDLYSNLEFLVDESLSSFLSKQGSSVDEFNDSLKSSIESAGAGTRDGVVAAGVSLIGSLAEMGAKLNYQWGGKYERIGVNPNWGTPADMSWLCSSASYGASYDSSVCYTNYKWHSFDCSGFVTWAVINGMQKTSITQDKIFDSSRISLNSSEAVCQPGGVLVGSGHIVLVVGTDDENKRYIVAESTGSRLNTGEGGVKLSYYSYGKSGYRCSNLNDIYGD